MERFTEKYEAVIGLEVHVQLSTESKLFCSDPAGFNHSPNSQTSSISLGLPGTLPMLNKAAIIAAVKLGTALHSQITSPFYFARKNYFYTDLPKGYQITQEKTPVCVGGEIPVRNELGEISMIKIHHIHMEEDAGKSIHDQDPSFSFIDLNRAGIPLLEIVSEPVIHSGLEAQCYLSEIRRLVRYLEICDGNMEEGNLRCDANVSIRPKGQSNLGTRTEIKNLNSLLYVKKAIEGEIQRQIRLVEGGEQVVQQTLSYSTSTGESVPIRSKEDAHDYRYFPEPDLAPVHLSSKDINDINKQLPSLPWEMYLKFTREFGLSSYDAGILTETPDISSYFNNLSYLVKNLKTAANFIIGPLRSLVSDQKSDFTQLIIQPAAIARMLDMVEEGQISFSVAGQQLLHLLVESPESDPYKLAQANQLLLVSNEIYLDEIISSVLRSFPEKVEQYKKGKKGLTGFFMGEIMKRSQGKADPIRCQELLKSHLD